MPLLMKLLCLHVTTDPIDRIRLAVTKSLCGVDHFHGVIFLYPIDLQYNAGFVIYMYIFFQLKAVTAFTSFHLGIDVNRTQS